MTPHTVLTFLRTTVRMLATLLSTAVLSFAIGTPMPWDSGFRAITTNLTGQTALGMVIAGVAGVGYHLVFSHGEMNEFARKGSYVSLAGGLLLGVPVLVRQLGLGAALV